MRGRTLISALVVWLIAGGAGHVLRSAPQEPRPNQDSLPPLRTQRPPLHGAHWMAVTGKPLGAAAGAMIFQQGGNAIDAACAMLGGRQRRCGTCSAGAARRRRSSTTRRTKKVIGINALGVAPTGATAEYYRVEGLQLPARVRPARRRHAGHAGRAAGDARGVRHDVARAGARAGDRDGRRLPDRSAGGRRHRTAEGRDQEVEVLAGASSCRTRGRTREAPEAGEIFRQPDLAATLRKLVDGRSRRAARQASRAPRRSRRRTTASTRATSRRRSCAACAKRAGCSRCEDLANWKVKIEEPLSTNYKGIEVYKLRAVAAGPGAAAGAEHPRDDRREGARLQQRRSTCTRSTRR